MDSNDARICWGKGLLAMRAQRWAEAIECFDAVIESCGGPASANPKLANAYSNKSLALRHLERHSEALLCIDQALRLNPTDADLWLNKANCLAYTQSWDDAFKNCQKAIALNPDLGKAWLRLACIWAEGFKRFDEALDCALRAQALGVVEAQEFARSCESYLEATTPHSSNEFIEAIGLAELANDCRKNGQLDEAVSHLRKALGVFQKHGDQVSIGTAYHQLGLVAQDRGDFGVAEDWYKKAVALRTQIGDEQNLATTLHQLGRIGQLTGNFAAAEQWCRRALEIKEKMHDEESAAPTYQLLGVIAEAKSDLANAERWCLKGLVIQERLGLHSGAGYSYNLLGAIARRQQDHVKAATYFIKSNYSFIEANQFEMATKPLENLALCYREAPKKIRATLRQMWNDAGYGKLLQLPE
jgi:tetratricopeptide (TPR) repeat protein